MLLLATEVTSVEMNKAGGLLLSGSKDNSNRLWDVRLVSYPPEFYFTCFILYSIICSCEAISGSFYFSCKHSITTVLANAIRDSDQTIGLRGVVSRHDL